MFTPTKWRASKRFGISTGRRPTLLSLVPINQTMYNLKAVLAGGERLDHGGLVYDIGVPEQRFQQMKKNLLPPFERSV